MNNLSAQQNEKILKGYLGVQGGESYTYKLIFTDSSGYLRGYSYTYLYENKEVKASISGFIDRENKTLSFKENNIIYNHGFESSTTICLINAVLKYQKTGEGKEQFSGAITSSDISNVYCGQGTVSFPYTEEIKQLTSLKVAEETPKPQLIKKPEKPLKVVYDTAAMSSSSKNISYFPAQPEQITSGTEKAIEWYSDSLVIQVWDGGKIDGDKLSITLNGAPLLNNYILAKEQKRIAIPLENGISELIFIANNEGNEPPMTANVWLVDGIRKHNLFIYNNIGKKARIKIKKVEK